MGFTKIVQGKQSRSGVVKSKIMNLLNIRTEYVHHTFFPVPVRRTAFRREKRDWRRRAHHRGEIPSRCTQRVHLEFFDLQAREVNIAGSFNDWRPGSTWMVSLGNGRWVKELLLPPGRYEYCFVVDGHWTLDPKAVESTPSQHGNHNSVLIVPHTNGNGHSRSFVLQPQRPNAPRCCASTH